MVELSGEGLMGAGGNSLIAQLLLSARLETNNYREKVVEIKHYSE